MIKNVLTGKRGSGKTTKLLYASEFNNAPILVHSNELKKLIKAEAQELNLNIPEPISVHDITDDRLKGMNEDILIDDLDMVVEELFKAFGFRNNILGASISYNGRIE